MHSKEVFFSRAEYEAMQHQAHDNRPLLCPSASLHASNKITRHKSRKPKSEAQSRFISSSDIERQSKPKPKPKPTRRRIHEHQKV